MSSLTLSAQGKEQSSFYCSQYCARIFPQVQTDIYWTSPEASYDSLNDGGTAQVCEQWTHTHTPCRLLQDLSGEKVCCTENTVVMWILFTHAYFRLSAVNVILCKLYSTLRGHLPPPIMGHTYKYPPHSACKPSFYPYTYTILNCTVRCDATWNRMQMCVCVYITVYNYKVRKWLYRTPRGGEV